jgi:hypothetical protein
MMLGINQAPDLARLSLASGKALARGVEHYGGGGTVGTDHTRIPTSLGIVDHPVATRDLSLDPAIPISDPSSESSE